MEQSSRIIICGFCGTKNRVPIENIRQKAFCGKCHRSLSVHPNYDHPVEVNDRNFQDEVLNFQGTVLAVFWVPWCGPCKMIMPTVDMFAQNYAGKIKVVKVNAEQNPMVSSYYKIDATPTFNFFRNGNLVRSFKGAIPSNELKQQADQILSWIM